MRYLMHISSTSFPVPKPSLIKNLFKIIFACIFIFNIQVNAQISEGGTPYSYNNNISIEAEKVIMPPVDVAALLAEDAIEEAKGIPFRFGFPFEVNYNLENSGTWINLPDGGKLWRLNIFSKGATTINLVYNDFWLPAGAKFFLYNSKRSELIGAFTERNNNEDGQFATGLIRGESIILEYYEPANVLSPGIINISSIIHGYKDIFKEYFHSDDFGTSGSCNINVNCPPGNNWQNEIRAAAMILTAGNFRLCSGSLVNNVRQDLTPYFLTANHCLSQTPGTWIIMFNYQSPQCSPNQDGPLNYTVQGTQIKANNAASDFALLLLNTAPPDSYNVHYAGWSALDIPATSGVGIHHPDGDVKKISTSIQPYEHDTWSGTPVSSHWRVRWTPDGSLGITEPGSSGSPQYDQNHHIVGQLHGGPSSCTASDKSDLYGKFSFSWNYGSTPSTRLKEWLDPDNTGTLVLDGWDPSIGTPDTVAPTTISDLAVIDPTSNSLKLTWTAPLDTSYGGVRIYDIRYSSVPITDTIVFNNAAPLQFSGIPASPGVTENLLVDDLDFSDTYYFAIRSKDMWNNWSSLSNSPAGTTLSAPQLSVDPDSLFHSLANYSTVVDTIFISNTSSNPSTLDFEVLMDNNTYPDNVKIRLLPGIKIIEEKIEPAKDDQGKYFSNGLSIEGSGGPDLFGYKWIDSDEPNGPLFNWNDITATGIPVTNWTATGTFDPKDEGIAGPFPLGFNFKFYGNPKSQVYFSTNGILLFNTVTSNIFTNAQIPSSVSPNEYIAPFWDDLDGRTQGTVHYKQDENRFIVQFTNWQKYSGQGSLTFQIVLHSNGKILFYYQNMSATLTSATVGIENAGGADGLQVVYNAAYVKNNLALQFAADPEWLLNNIFNGTIYNGNSAAVELTFNSEDYPAGNYSMDMIITTNDPSAQQVVVPVKMTIEDEIPVELVSFSAVPEANKVNLYWNTITETNNSGFEIERRFNKDAWEKIAFITGSGNSTVKKEYSFTDNSSLAAGKYLYRLKQIDFDGSFEYSNEIEAEIETPKDFSLRQNYPNPFNPSTTIEFSLPEKSDVIISIYSAIGELVKSFVSYSLEPGYHQTQFNAIGITSGIYFYQIDAKGETKNFSSTKKMILMK
jgi:hypothetical protein